MVRRTLSTAQGVSLLVLFFSSNALLFGDVCSGMRDGWLSALLAGAVMVPVGLMFARLLHLFPGMDFFAILERCFGRIAGAVLTVVLVLYILMEGSFALRVFAEFIHVTSLSLTPTKVIMLTVLLVCVYMGRSGMQTLGRWSVVALPAAIFVLALSVVMSGADLDFRNLLPLMETGWRGVVSSGYFRLVYPFGEWVIVLAVLDALRPDGSARRVFGWAVGICTLLLTVVFIRNMTLLGQEVYGSIYFPSYYASKAGNVSTTFGRMEFLLLLITIVCFIAKMTVCLMAACRGLARLFRLGNGIRLMFPTAAFMMGAGVICATGITQMKTMIPQFYPYFVPYIQFGIPLVCWMVAEWRKKNLSPMAAGEGRGVS